MNVSLGLMTQVPQHEGIWLQEYEYGSKEPAGSVQVSGSNKVQICMATETGGFLIEIEADYENKAVKVSAVDRGMELTLAGGPEGMAAMRLHNVQAAMIKGEDPGDEIIHTENGHGDPVG